jgi:hypothetical protein
MTWYIHSREATECDGLAGRRDGNSASSPYDVCHCRESTVASRDAIRVLTYQISDASRTTRAVAC